jgi:hypothetical protein
MKEREPFSDESDRHSFIAWSATYPALLLFVAPTRSDPIG